MKITRLTRDEQAVTCRACGLPIRAAERPALDPVGFWRHRACLGAPEHPSVATARRPGCRNAICGAPHGCLRHDCAVRSSAPRRQGDLPGLPPRAAS